MKKNTFFLMALVTSIASAQDLKSYLDGNPSDHKIAKEGNQNITIIKDARGGGDLTTYTVKAAFEEDYANSCTEPLLYEDFLTMPGGITTCGPMISSAGDGCFPAGSLMDGFNITAAGAGGEWLTIAISPGSIGNANALVGANTFMDYTIVTFPENNVRAVGQTIYNNNSSSVQYRAFDEDGNLIDTVVVSVPAGSEVFFGIISEVNISKVEIEADADSGELIAHLQFGVCSTTASVQDNLYSNVNLYPNPANDFLTISVPSNVSVNNVVVYDILGKKSNVTYNNGNVNISSLSTGVYIISIETSQGLVTKRIVKK